MRGNNATMVVIQFMTKMNEYNKAEFSYLFMFIDRISITGLMCMLYVKYEYIKQKQFP